MRRQATFVAPQAPPAVLVDDRRQTVTTHSVRAEWLQNAGGGLGAGILVECAWLSVHGALYAIGIAATPWPDAAQVTIAATIVGAVVFGVLMLVRSALDEVVESLDWQRTMADLEAADEEIGLLRTQLEEAERRAKVAELSASVQAANQVARGNRRVEPVPERAEMWRNCEKMIHIKFSTGNWSRDRMMQSGCTKQDWETTMTALQRAGLAVKNGRAREPTYATEAEMQDALHKYERNVYQAKSVVGTSSDEATTRVTDDLDE